MLWTSQTFVDFEVGLNSAVRKLREALDDSADNPRFVETLPRRGYRFVAPVSLPAVASASPAAPVSLGAVPEVTALPTPSATEAPAAALASIPARRPRPAVAGV